MTDPVACKMWTDRTMELAADYNREDTSSQLHIDDLPTTGWQQQKPYNKDKSVNCNYIKALQSIDITGPNASNLGRDNAWHHYYNKMSAKVDGQDWTDHIPDFDISGPGQNQRDASTSMYAETAAWF